jgi:hypothetical protein
MGETIEYWLKAEFDRIEAANKFANEKSIREFFRKVELKVKTVTCRDCHGGRGNGPQVGDILQQEIGRALHRHSPHMTRFTCAALYTECAPWDSFKLVVLQDIPGSSEVRE